jgi:hypothetical protein
MPIVHRRKSSICECLKEATGPLTKASAVKAIEEGRAAGHGLDIVPERIEIVEEEYL